MKFFLNVLTAGVLACNLAACGVKGNLKTPTQIKVEEQKKAREEAKKKTEKTPTETPAEQ